jgi:hypothetical protein
MALYNTGLPGSDFDCDICGDFGMCEYDVTFTDFTKAELCESCLAMSERDGRVLLSARFAGLN